MRKATVSRMRERYAQTELTFRITYVILDKLNHVLFPLTLKKKFVPKRYLPRPCSRNGMFSY